MITRPSKRRAQPSSARTLRGLTGYWNVGGSPGSQQVIAAPALSLGEAQWLKQTFATMLDQQVYLSGQTADYYAGLTQGRLGATYALGTLVDQLSGLKR